MGEFMYTAGLVTQWHFSFNSCLRGGLLLVLALILSQPGAGWAKGMSDEEVLLKKLNTAAKVQQTEALGKSRRPAARLVFGGADQISAIEKLRAIANAKIASISPKLKGNEQDAGALWFEKLVDQAQILRENSPRKPAIAKTHGVGKVVAVQQADRVFVFLCPLTVHAEQHFGPIVGIGAAIAGIDGQDGTGVVMRSI